MQNWSIEDLDRLTQIEEAFGWRASQHVIGPMRRELLRLERLTGALEAELPVTPEMMEAIHLQIQEDLNAQQKREDRLANVVYGATLGILTFVGLRFLPIPVPPVPPLAVLAIAAVTGIVVARRRIKTRRLL